MPTLKDMRDERATVWEQMKTHLDAGDGEAYDKAEARYDELDKDIDRAERHEQRAAANARVDRTGVVPDKPGGDDGDETDAAYARAFTAFLRGGTDELKPEDKVLLRQNFRQPQQAAGVGTPAGGGYLVPPAFRDTVIETMKAFGPMLQVAEVIETNTGATLPWPTNDDTANVGAILAENTQVTEQDVTLGTANLDAYMYTSKLVRASYQLLQDRPDFDTWLARKLGERIGRILNMHFTTGTGTAQPDGIVTSATTGGVGTGSFASTGGLTYDAVIDVEESIDPAYAALGGQSFMMHQTARKQIRKLKNSQGDFLWQPSLQAGTPATLDGYAVQINNDMPTLAQSSKSILFGNFREAYVIRIVRELTTLRLTERYADFLQVGFLGFERADGTMQNSGAVRVLQTSTTA